MKVIFLDIDGVLNTPYSSSTIDNYIGVDDNKIKRLAEIVKATKASIILTSTWKIGWEPNYKSLAKHAIYLDACLKRFDLKITDKTRERNLRERGMGIRSYLLLYPEIDSWVVLDDEIFPDYRRYKIFPHLIQTSPKHGLSDKNVKAAIKLLNG